jgi:hypothetical protein
MQYIPIFKIYQGRHEIPIAGPVRLQVRKTFEITRKLAG